MTDIKEIKTEEEYEQILKRIEEIFDSKPNTPEANELEYLVGLVEKYEEENYPIDKPSPKAAIRFRMEQWGLDAKRLIPSNDMIIHLGETLKEVMEDRNISAESLAQATGFTQDYINAVLNCKENISAEFAKKLEDTLNIDTDFWMKLQELYDDELKTFEESQLG
jgi:addiction module HigA family antidote